MKHNYLAIAAIVLILLGLFAVPACSTSSQDSGQAIVSLTVNDSGVLQEDLDSSAFEGAISLHMESGTVARGGDGSPITSILISEVAEPAPLSSGAHIVGPAYDLSPDGATFAPSFQLALRYDADFIPDGIDVQTLCLAFYDAGTRKWVEVPSTHKSGPREIFAAVDHFTQFAVYAPAPVPAPTPTPAFTPTPTPHSHSHAHADADAFSCTNTPSQPNTLSFSHANALAYSYTYTCAICRSGLHTPPDRTDGHSDRHAVAHS